MSDQNKDLIESDRLDDDQEILPYIKDENGKLRPLEGVESIFLTSKNYLFSNLILIKNGSTDTTVEICKLDELCGGGEGAIGHVLKEVILSDIQFRGAISDFHPIKNKIQNADYDPLLIKYNLDDIYNDGNNFEVLNY